MLDATNAMNGLTVRNIMRNLTTASLLTRLLAATLGRFGTAAPKAHRDNASPTTDRRHKRGILGLPSEGYRHNARSGGLARTFNKALSRRDRHRMVVKATAAAR